MRTASDMPRRMRRVLTVIAVLLALSVIASGCGGDDSDTLTGEEAALSAAVDDIAAACNDRDHGRLRDLSGVGIQDRLRDQDNVFNADIEEIVVIDRQITVDGDTATAAVILEITVDAETTEIERVWEFEQVDDTWVLSTVPDCISN